MEAHEQQQQRDLLAQIELQCKSMAEAEAAVAKAAVEVAELAAKLAPESPSRGGAGAADGQSPASDVAPPSYGYVSDTFAVEHRPEREAAFAQQLDQLQARTPATMTPRIWGSPLKKHHTGAIQKLWHIHSSCISIVCVLLRLLCSLLGYLCCVSCFC